MKVFKFSLLASAITALALTFSLDTSAQGCTAGTSSDLQIHVNGGFPCSVTISINYTPPGGTATLLICSGTAGSMAMHLPFGSTINHVDVNGHTASFPHQEFPDACGTHSCPGGGGNCMTLGFQQTDPYNANIDID